MKQLPGGKSLAPTLSVRIHIPFWAKVGYYFRSRKWAPATGILVKQTKVMGHEGWQVQTRHGIWFITDNFLERIL